MNLVLNLWPDELHSRKLAVYLHNRVVAPGSLIFLNKYQMCEMPQSLAVQSNCISFQAAKLCRDYVSEKCRKRTDVT